MPDEIYSRLGRCFAVQCFVRCSGKLGNVPSVPAFLGEVLRFTPRGLLTIISRNANSKTFCVVERQCSGMDRGYPWSHSDHGVRQEGYASEMARSSDVDALHIWPVSCDFAKKMAVLEFLDCLGNMLGISCMCNVGYLRSYIRADRSARDVVCSAAWLFRIYIPTSNHSEGGAKTSERVMARPKNGAGLSRSHRRSKFLSITSGCRCCSGFQRAACLFPMAPRTCAYAFLYDATRSRGFVGHRMDGWCRRKILLEKPVFQWRKRMIRPASRGSDGREREEQDATSRPAMSGSSGIHRFFAKLGNVPSVPAFSGRD